jgi:hypothetical protein
MKLLKNKIFLRSRQYQNIQRHPVFKQKSRRFLTERVTDSSEQFVQELFTEQLNEEITTIYNNLKNFLQLRRREIKKNIMIGAASVETTFFQYSIEIIQNRDEPREAVFTRFLRFHQELSTLPEATDKIFPITMNEVIVPLLKLPEYDDLVEKFEDLEDRDGGSLTEDDQELMIKYKAPSGIYVCLDIKENELIIIPQKSYPVLQLLREGLVSINSVLN